MKIDSTNLALARRVAAGQAGILTRVQADGLGIGNDVRRRLLADNSWRRILPGVYALTPESWLQRAWAGVLIGGPRATLGYEASLKLWGLASEPEQIPVFVGRHAGFPQDDRWRFIRSTRTRRSEPPRTSVAEAIIDVGTRWKMDDLLMLVGSAVTGHRVTVSGLQAELDSRSRHSQRHLVQEVIDAIGSGTTTVLEHHYRHDVEIPHGLPTPQRQVSPCGRYRVDNWYDLYKLIVEVDGRATHVGLAAAVDMERDNFHMAHGISTLRFTWAHVVHDPCRTAQTVAQALTRSGWTGHIHPCPNCSSKIGRDPAA